MPGCIANAFICTVTTCGCSDCRIGLGNKSELCCLVEECCLACGEEPLGCGMVTNEDNDEYCKIGCCLFACGLKSPQRLCSFAQYFLCMKSKASFPFTKGYVENCHCALCCLSCAPECGCCLETRASPHTSALNVPIKDYSYVQKKTMER